MLEELDRMDWGRFLRAIEAQEIERVEFRRKAYIGGKVEKLDKAEWAAIKAHDDLLGVEADEE